MRRIFFLTQARKKPGFFARRAATSYIKPGLLRTIPGLFEQKVRGLSGSGPRPHPGIARPGDCPEGCTRRHPSRQSPGIVRKRAFPGLHGSTPPRRCAPLTAQARGLSGSGLSDGCPILSGGGPGLDIPRTFCPKSPGKARKRPGFIYDVAALRAQKTGFSRASVGGVDR